YCGQNRKWYGARCADAARHGGDRRPGGSGRRCARIVERSTERQFARSVVFVAVAAVRIQRRQPCTRTLTSNPSTGLNPGQLGHWHKRSLFPPANASLTIFVRRSVFRATKNQCLSPNANERQQGFVLGRSAHLQRRKNH